MIAKARALSYDGGMKPSALVPMLLLLASCTPGPEGHARIVRFSTPSPAVEQATTPVEQRQPKPEVKPTPPPAAAAQIQPPLPPAAKPEPQAPPAIKPPLPPQTKPEVKEQAASSGGWFSQKQPQPEPKPESKAESKPEPKKEARKPGPARLPAEHAAFRNMSSYPRTMAVWKDSKLLNAKGPRRVVINLAQQRGMFFINDQVAMDFPVCTGTKSKPTPRGNYRIIEKREKHRSNLYHCSMPYFMRLTYDGIGLHVGPVRRSPSSHGCIRLTREACVPLFRNAPKGTPVEIH